MTGYETFMLQRMGAEEGPYTLADLRAQAQVAYIRPMTMVRRADGVGSWFTAQELPGVFSEREWLVAVLISFFLGTLGIDRFYLGYIGLGILKLITLGGCGVWWLIDLILIAMGNLKDSAGLPLRRN